jgi:hypothetical protein
VEEYYKSLRNCEVGGLDLSKLSPYELGETKKVEAIEYLTKFLETGTKNEGN